MLAVVSRDNESRNKRTKQRKGFGKVFGTRCYSVACLVFRCVTIGLFFRRREWGLSGCGHTVVLFFHEGASSSLFCFTVYDF